MFFFYELACSRDYISFLRNFEANLPFIYFFYANIFSNFVLYIHFAEIRVEIDGTVSSLLICQY